MATRTMSIETLIEILGVAHIGAREMAFTTS
jgi:hypothetical protein